MGRDDQRQAKGVLAGCCTEIVKAGPVQCKLYHGGGRSELGHWSGDSMALYFGENCCELAIRELLIRAWGTGVSSIQGQEKATDEYGRQSAGSLSSILRGYSGRPPSAYPGNR